jgi:tRNA nucleotidyltransferase (CCA-adding enzyme)
MDPKKGIAVPPPVVSVIEKLRSCGHTAFIAGGAVRDIVMNRQRPVDWDIATSATPIEVASCFDHVVPTGLVHGTVTVVAGDMNIEVTTYRHDGPYVDGRRPEYVEYLDDIVADLARRDFTVNAMAFDPTAGELVDPYGGADDIERRLIRCVGDPAQRFSEDKLRMLRAVRFAATLGFDVDASIVDSARKLAPGIEQVSVERIMDELMKTMCAPKPGAALMLMEEMGLTSYVLPELCSEVGEKERKGLYAACDLLSPEPEERFAALLWPLGSQGSRRMLARMRTSRAFATAVSRIIEGATDLDDDPSDYQLRLAASRIGRDHLFPAVRLKQALRGDGERMLANMTVVEEKVRSVLAERPPLGISDLHVGGKEIMEATGLSPGPGVRMVLQRLLHEALRDPSVNNKECLLDMAREIGDEMGKAFAD